MKPPTNWPRPSPGELERPVSPVARRGGGRLAEIDGRLDLVSVRLDEVDALERAARDVLDKLRRGDEPPASDLADQIAALRRERAAADQRAETLLQGVQEVIDRLVDRLSGAAADRPPHPGTAPGSRREPTAIRIVDPSALDALDLFDPPRPPSGATSPRIGSRTPPPPVSTGISCSSRARRLGAPAPPETECRGKPRAGAPTPPISAHIAAARRAAQSAVAHPDAEVRRVLAERRTERAPRRAFLLRPQALASAGRSAGDGDRRGRADHERPPVIPPNV